MPLPNEAEVKAVLTKFSRRIRRAINAGFRSFVLRTAGAPNLFGRTNAADVFDCVAQALVSEFADDGAVKIFDERGTLRLLFDGKVLARFKKAGPRGVGSNMRTWANDKFLNPALPFPDAPTATKVEVCWKINETGTSFDSLRVVARKGEGALWAFELPGAEPLPLFAPQPKASAERPRKSVVKLKAKKPASERDAS